LFRYTEGLGLIARAGLLLLFAPIMGDRTHPDAANRCNGLRKRSAGRAAKMFLRNGHWNNLNVHIAGSVPSGIFFRRVKIA
jgi:hypothetical protein